MSGPRLAGLRPRFNPWWGCAKVSPGCSRCYAETWSRRTGEDIWGVNKPRRLFGDKHWAEPLRWNRKAEERGRPMLVFCASMADVFEDHPMLPDQRERLWRLIDDTPWLVWQLLTKRPENVEEMVPWVRTWPPNVWLGVSVEDQRRAEERVSILVGIRAGLRFLSCEPLLGPVDLTATPGWGGDCPHCGRDDCWGGEIGGPLYCGTTGREAPEHVDWVIVGGESGGRARGMDLAWARSLVAQCHDQYVPVFVKQLGAKPYTSRVIDGEPPRRLFRPTDLRLRDKKGEDWEEWPADLRVREMPTVDEPTGVGV